DGIIEDKELKGNIYINFVGDPSFTNQNLKKLFVEIKNLGINKLTGNILVNRTAFDNTFYPSGWMWDDMDSCDSSPVDALYIDDNCIKVNIISNQNKIYSHTNNIVDINSLDIKISNDKENNIKVDGFNNNTLKISGKMANGKTEELEQSIIYPELYLSNVLKNIINNYFEFQGQIKVTSDIPSIKNLNTIATNTSQPLSDILKRFDKESHNLTGELLIKTIALNDNKIQGSTEKGINIMKKYLTDTFAYTDFNIVDGSGLSRYNLVSPSLIISALDYMYNQDKLKNVVLNSFPIGGQDGTLKNRLKKIVNYRVVAKSGSMTGVNCLSGYLIGENGNNYSFSIMINNTVLSGKKLRDIQDEIIKIIDML
ncbi:MAG: D-alanyl-D-alanine carboxypeptidase/D-alanyl-D-alanine-endopeptidase, partial [Candidatus Sericytochromatia bacterium]|nr:D-alanyl-D-alanine carboxypeptidase/D-alanyl-D-alanine-endopeptidase [Candidatus Sericytochromatia bacterium]